MSLWRRYYKPFDHPCHFQVSVCLGAFRQNLEIEKFQIWTWDHSIMNRMLWVYVTGSDDKMNKFVVSPITWPSDGDYFFTYFEWRSGAVLYDNTICIQNWYVVTNKKGKKIIQLLEIQHSNSSGMTSWSMFECSRSSSISERQTCGTDSLRWSLLPAYTLTIHPNPNRLTHAVNYGWIVSYSQNWRLLNSGNEIAGNKCCCYVSFIVKTTLNFIFMTNDTNDSLKL